MNLPATLHVMNGTSRRGLRGISRMILAVLVAAAGMGFAVSAFAADSGGTVTHNPKQTVEPGKEPKSAELTLDNVSAKSGKDGSEVTLSVTVSSKKKKEDTLLDEDHPAKLNVETSDGTAVKPKEGDEFKITKLGETGDLSFDHKQYKGCKFKVTLVGDLWGTDSKGEPKDVELDDCKGSGGGTGDESVMFRYGLGWIHNGADGGVLKFESNAPSAEMYSPKSLLINLSPQYVTRDPVTGVFQSAVTDDTVTTITNVVENQGYTIEFAHRNGGVTGATFKTVTISNPGATVVANTQDQHLFQEERWDAGSFKYEIPLQDDSYKIQLYFAELYHDHAGGGVFSVTAEGNTVLSNYDIFQAAGGRNTARVEEVPAIVRDGSLSLGFGAVTFGAHVSAVKIVRGDAVPIAGTDDDALYQSERTGDFSWHADLPAGNYNVTLLFAETTYDSVGRRTFNVTALGATVLSNYDIYAHAGLNTAGVETFPVTVTSSGLDLQFASVNGQAKICAILIKDASTEAVAAAVNAGGEAFTAADGTIFAADSSFSGGVKNYPGRVVAAIDVGSSSDYTAQDGTVFKADTGSFGGKVYAGVFNRFNVTEQEGTLSPRVSEFSWVSDPRTGEFTECLLNKGGIQVEGKREVWSQDRQSYDKIHTIEDSTGHVLSKTATTYEFKRFGVAKVREVEDPDGAAISTAWTYEEGTGIPGDPVPSGYGREKQMTRTNGYWEQYGYDANGQRNKTVSQYLDSSLGDEANSRVETVTYSTSNPTETRIVKIQGKEVSRSYVAKFTSSTEDERWEITCATPSAAWNASSNLVSKICRYSNDYSVEWLRGRLKWSSAPDGVLTTYSYAQSGANLVTTRDQGAGSGSAVTAGTRTVTTTNSSGNAIAENVSDIASGLAVSSWTATDVDDLGRVTQKTYGDGSTESTVYVGSAPGCTACSGNHDLVDSETSREGITTSYKYDVLGRRTEMARLGITEKSTLDAAGRETKSERIGTDGSTITLSESHYDNAGRMDWTKDALGNQTDIAYSPDGLTTTTTYPYGTRIETSYKDGKTKEISGTALAPAKYTYGSWSDASGGGEWTEEIKVGENGAETEWVKTYSDLVGRSVKTEYPDGAVATQSYNGLGQLVKSVDPDGVVTLFAYNSKGEQETTALDFNGNGVIDFGGTDRITRAVRDVTSHGGTVVNRTTTSQWMQNNVDGATVVAVNEQGGYGNKSWQKDAGGNETAIERTLLGAGAWTETATRPDGSQTVQSYQNGRLASTALKASTGNQLQATSFHYDEHGRMDAQTDARNGTTNFTYDNADQMRTKTEPSVNGTAARQLTQYDYNTRGQLTKTTLPDTTETHNDYYPTGALQKTYGSQTYTVDYTYDSQGRMRTMTTTGQAGPAVTTWNYDPQRGWLKTKVYADGKGPEYTYTLAGRLATRKWARGIVTTYDYTAGDLTGIDYSDTTPDVTYAYNRRGLRDTVTDASGTRSIGYNAAGEVANETYTAGLMNGLSVERSFDTLLRRDGLILKNASTTLHSETLGYGEASRLDHITSGQERVDYGYEPNSTLVHTVTFKHNGSAVMTTTKDYDFVNRLTEIKSVTGSTTVSRYAYDYNALNQRSKTTLADSGYWSYDYNAKGEVINGTRKDANGNAISGENFGYEFDGIGNRLTTSIDGATESSYTANALNQYTAINSTSPTYDDDGNLTNDGSKLLTYNGENRLVQVKDLNSTLIATYIYDDQGRRMRKITTAQAPQGAQDLVFLWDGWNTGAQLSYQQSTNTWQLEEAYTWGLDFSGTLQDAGGVGGLVLEKDAAGDGYFPSYDGNGNLVKLIQASGGSVVASYAYDPFGNTMSLAGSYSDQNPWRFSTKWWESETELLAFQFRHFSSSLGRWINLDPTWEEAFKCMVVNHLALRNSVKLRVPDVMPYAFVKNDPINRIDYYGLQTGLIQGLDITITTENGSYFTGYTATDITTSGEITACKDEDLYITVKNDPYDVKKMAEENGPIAMAGVDTESGRAYPTVTNYTDQPDVKGDRLWDTVNNPSSFAKTPITDIQVNVAKGKWKPGGKANVVIRWKDSTERWTREISIK